MSDYSFLKMPVGMSMNALNAPRATASPFSFLGSGTGYGGDASSLARFGTGGEFAPTGINSIGSGSDTGLFTKNSMFGEGGWAMPAAQVGAGLLQGFMGLKQLKLAKDMFRQQSEYAATDLANQAKTVNERLETRQARRVRENPSTTPVNEFMSKYAVSGKAGG